MATFDDYIADSNHVLTNPERGMYSSDLGKPNFGDETLPLEQRNYHTIVPEWLWLAPWCDKPLVWDPTNPQDTTSEVLKDYAGKLEDARSGGYKILFRPRYDNEEDPGEVSDECMINGVPVFHAVSKKCQFDHIEAVAAMLGAYKDVIAFIQAGYLGNWGEWNTAGGYAKENAPLLYNRTDRSDILDHILFAYAAAGIAQDVELRTPVFAKEVVERWEKPENSDIYHGASPNVGLHNDCFMVSKDISTEVWPDISGSDFGTYSDFSDFSDGIPQNFGNEPAARKWAGAWTENSSFGGETCPRTGLEPSELGLERWRSCTNMTGATSEPAEPASLHMNYLNHDYAKAVDGFSSAVDEWQKGGCYDEIRRRLGYRFEVRSVEYPETVSAGETFRVAVDVVNTGWARLHKPRIAKLVLRHGAPPDPDKEVHDLDGGKVETWEPGDQPKQLSITTQAPSTPGKYSVRLWIPDPDLQDNDPDEVLEVQEDIPKATINYAVKLATLRNGANVFDQTTGENDLGVEIEVQ